MSAVNPRRPYDSRSRQAQARQNQAAVRAAARHLFLAQGYAATTMASIAAEAGVSVETIYKAFGNKPGVLRALFEVVVGDDDDESLPSSTARSSSTCGPSPTRRRSCASTARCSVAARPGCNRSSSSRGRPRRAIRPPPRCTSRSGTTDSPG